MPDKKLTDNLSNNSPILSNGLSDNKIVKAMSKKDRAFENLIEVARLWKEKYNNAKKELFDKTAENKRLKDNLEQLNGQYLIQDMALQTAKAEAYKEFAYELKQIPNVVVYKYEIDNLLKELEGE